MHNQEDSAKTEALQKFFGRTVGCTFVLSGTFLVKTHPDGKTNKVNIDNNQLLKILKSCL